MNYCCKNKCKCPYPCFIPRPEIPELKTIALLELTGLGEEVYDIPLKKTFEYYFANSNQFKKFPIVNTNSSLKKTLELLDYYYIAGYRIFIGFSDSNILKGVLPWFNNHPKAIGISPDSTTSKLEMPKNIYRLTPPETNLIEEIESEFTEFFLSRRYIFYVYSVGEIDTESILELLLSEGSPVKDKIVPIPINPDSSNINDVQTIYKEKDYSPFRDVAIDYLIIGNQRENFIKLFLPSFIPVPTFDISLETFPWFYDDIHKSVWNNLYYSFQNINLSTSPLWRKAYNELPYYEFNTIALDVLQLNNTLKTKNNVEEISNYAFVQQFDKNKDTIYFSYSGFKYTFNLITKTEKWIPDSIYVKDPIFGTFYKSLSN